MTMASPRSPSVAGTDRTARRRERYRIEVLDPGTAFAGDVVLLARCGDRGAGCVVITDAGEKLATTALDHAPNELAVAAE